MTPKIISSDIFKYRKEIDHDTLAKIIVKGGPVAGKEAMKIFGYDENENIAIPTIVIGGDGSIGGTKWTVLGKAPKKVTIKGIQLWPECEDEVHIALEVPEFDTFTFYNRCRNISGWIDSTELTWSVMRKNEKNKKVKVQPTNYEKTGIRGFSIRMGVMPVRGHQQPHPGYFPPRQGRDQEEDGRQVQQSILPPGSPDHGRQQCEGHDHKAGSVGR